MPDDGSYRQATLYTSIQSLRWHTVQTCTVVHLSVTNGTDPPTLLLRTYTRYCNESRLIQSYTGLERASLSLGLCKSRGRRRRKGRTKTSGRSGVWEGELKSSPLLFKLASGRRMWHLTHEKKTTFLTERNESCKLVLFIFSFTFPCNLKSRQ